MTKLPETQIETNFDIQEAIKRFDITDELYPQFVLADSIAGELERRKGIKNKAIRLMKEYRNMSDKEQEKFKTKRNRPGQYTKEQLQQLANSDIEPPESFGSGDLKARPVKECRQIMEVLLEHWDPERGRPVWNQAVNELRDRDISISDQALKRYWTAIQEKDAYQIVKEKFYWNILERFDETADALFDHVMDRVGSEDGKWDKMDDRVDALVKIIEMMKSIPRDQPQEVKVQKEETKKELRIKEFSDEEVEDIEQGDYSIEED